MTRKRRLWRLRSEGLVVPAGKILDRQTKSKRVVVERVWHGVRRPDQAASVVDVQSEQVFHASDIVYQKTQTRRVELVEVLGTEPVQISAWSESEAEPLSCNDAKLVLSLIENPPEPSKKLVNAMKMFQDEFEM